MLTDKTFTRNTTKKQNINGWPVHLTRARKFLLNCLKLRREK